MATCKIFFLLLALCIWCGKCQVLYKRVGDEVSMECGVGSNRDVEWKFNSELIMSVNGKTGQKRKGNNHIVEKARLNVDILKVSRLETRDAGVYSCRQSGKQFTLHIVSVFVKPGPVLVQSSKAELHCDITGESKAEVEWLRPPNNEKYNVKKRAINLGHVTSNEAGQWTCLVNNVLKVSVTLTVVVGLQTTAVNVSEGDDIELPCSLSQSVSQRVVGGKWKADHLPKVSFPSLTNTKGLHWNGEKSSKVNFTTEQLSTNFDVTLNNVESSDAGTFVCTVKFEGGASLSGEMTLRVVDKPSGGKGSTKGGKRSTKGKGKTTAVQEILNKDFYGVQLWIWIAVGASSVVLIGLIVMAVLIHKRNKRKKRVRKLRSMRQPLTARDYCQCNRSEKELELEEQAKPLPVPRQHRNSRTRTAGPNHIN